MDRGLKQGAGPANLRKREKTNGKVGAKNRCVLGQPKEKEKPNGLVGAKNRVGRANLRKREKTNGLLEAKNRGRGGPT